MTDFDFKRYHLRSINAGTEAERQAINAELKTLYASLDEAGKARFNLALQAFLVKEYQAIGSEYEAIRASSARNDA